jgi:hypothetical protein
VKHRLAPSVGHVVAGKIAMAGADGMSCATVKFDD